MTVFSCCVRKAQIVPTENDVGKNAGKDPDKDLDAKSDVSDDPTVSTFVTDETQMISKNKAMVT